MKNILFRVDSSSKIGTGHVMRSLVLSNRFKNQNIIFATLNLNGNINQKILDSGFRVEFLKSNSREELNALVEKLKIDLLIVDHYEIDYEFEKNIKLTNPSLELMVLDDTYKRHYCDILLNHNIYGSEKKYKDLVSSSCKLLCGSKYTLIRDEFKKQKSKRVKKSKNFKVLIALGGSDFNNYTLEVFKLLKRFKNLDVKVATTSANVNIKSLKKFTFLNKNFEILINCNDMAKRINESDLVIVSPSTICYEVMFLEKEFIAIKTASNQKYMYEYLKNRNRDVLEKFDSNKLFYKIKKVLNVR